MTTNSELRALAEAVPKGDEISKWHRPGCVCVLCEFEKAANPQRVLALLAQLDAVKTLAKAGIEKARQQPDDYSGPYYIACGVDEALRDVLEALGE